MRVLVVAIGLLCAAPPSSSSAPFHVDDRVAVRTKLRDDAAACLVHLHGNEPLARETMLALQGSSCTNALWFTKAGSDEPWPVERIPLPTTGGACTVNPNRVFTASGRKQAIERDCDDDPVAQVELERFVADVLAPKLAACRGDARRLPVVAFHNNSNLTLGEMDARSTFRPDKKAPPGNFLLVTRDADFQRLVALARFDAALQNDPPADDGSLSVALHGERYINVEALLAPQNRAADRAMGEQAIRLVDALACRVPR